MRKACANLKKTQTPEMKIPDRKPPGRRRPSCSQEKGAVRAGVLLFDRQGNRECHGTEDQDVEQSLYGHIVLKRLFFE
ncbi:MAG TPA: hypothetical protein PKV94_09215 [Syntrophales bacterium]|nr:hypothetical protein [Syntrophales bacterium]HPN25173.1 hypothetical protein [Syntrophales bacterium]